MRRALKGDDEELIVDNKEISEMLNHQFSSIFEKEAVVPLPEFKKRTCSFFGGWENSWKNKWNGIKRRLKRLKEDKSIGPDLIRPKILLECA